MAVFLPWGREGGDKTSVCEIVGKRKGWSRIKDQIVRRGRRMLSAGADGRLECLNL